MSHAAIYTVREGRGYGRQLVPVIDVAPVGKGAALHVIAAGKPVCGQRGELGDVLDAVDPRAMVVLRRPVCATCRGRLGTIPPVEFERDIASAA